MKKIMSKLHLRQPQFIRSARGLFDKHFRMIKIFKGNRLAKNTFQGQTSKK